jgi:hypothetical protein
MLGMKPIWVKSRWSAEELNGQAVRFSLVFLTQREPGLREKHSGRGKFCTRAKPDDSSLLCLEIATDGPKPEASGSATQSRTTLTQEQADAIVRNPEGDDCAFSLEVTL